MDYIDTIINGDSEIILKDIPDESVDCMVTDPPYGLTSPGAKNATGGFMGKAWDKAVPSVAIWKECLRVMKPGAFAFVMCIPRQDCLARMIVNLEDAGFNVSYSSLLHSFASGFPKAQSVSKVIDKRLGAEREVVGFDKAWNKLCGKSKDGAWADSKWNTNSGEVGKITTPATPEAQALDGAYSNYSPKPAYEVIIVASKPVTAKHRRSDVYEMLDGKYNYWYTQRTVVKEPDENSKGNIEKLSEKWTDELQGYVLKDGDVIERRLALRPELQDEVIINRETVLRSKPYKDTDITSTITQALATGKSITWLDDGRIAYESEDNKWGGHLGTGLAKNKFFSDGEQTVYMKQCNQQGRFSPNLLVSDDVLNDGKIRKSGGVPDTPRSNTCWEGHNAPRTKKEGDSGSYSRYFSLDAWSEKNLPESVQRTFPFLIVPKASKSEKNAGLDELEDKEMYYKDGRGNSLEIKCNAEHQAKSGRKPPEPRKNHHPTCKPIKLMSYLISIGSRPGDVILDPFVGSGTTAIAAAILDRRYLGIELDAEMVDISERRIKWHVEQAEKDAEPQPDMFSEATGD